MPITPLPEAPSRSTPATFSDLADAFLGALETFVTEANALAENVNTKEATVVADTVLTEAAAAVALAAANYVGPWSDQSGAATVPYAVSHLDQYWQLTENLADVTTKTPGTDPEWIVIGTNVVQATGFTGGAAGDLDATSYIGLSTGRVARVVSGTLMCWYVYNSTSSTAENSPHVIAPDDIGANPGRWLLLGMGPLTVTYMADKVKAHGTEPTAADADAIATAQTPGGAGNLTLTASPYTPDVPRKITITSDADDSGVTFTITYKDENGDAQTSDAMTGPSSAAITVQKGGVDIWASEVSQIAISGAGTGNITAGISDGLVTFDLGDGGVHTITPAADFTYRFANWPASGWEIGMSLVITNGGAVDITDPVEVDQEDGEQPTLTDSGRDRLVFATLDGGTTVDKMLAAVNLS